MSGGLGLLFLTSVLVSGYVFSSTFLRTKYQISRASGYSLQFASGYIGFYLFIINLVLVLFLVPRINFLSNFCNEADIKSSNLTLFQVKSIIVSILTVITSPIYALILNIFTPEERKLRNLKKSFVSELEELILDAASRELLFAVSLKSGKEYVGRIIDSFEPSVDFQLRDISIMPMLSGYRDEKDKKVHYNLRYEDFYEELKRQNDFDNIYRQTGDNESQKKLGEFMNDLEEKFSFRADLRHLKPSDFYVVLPVSEINSARIFDIDAYLVINHYNKLGQANP